MEELERLEHILSTEYTEAQKKLMFELLKTFMICILPNDVENMLSIVHKCRLLSWSDLHTTVEFLSLLQNSGLERLGFTSENIERWRIESETDPQ